jgi:hypothetical protein
MTNVRCNHRATIVPNLQKHVQKAVDKLATAGNCSPVKVAAGMYRYRHIACRDCEIATDQPTENTKKNWLRFADSGY